MPKTVQDIALELCMTGWWVLPVVRGEKACKIRKWQTDVRFQPDAIPRHFQGDNRNIGLLLGECQLSDVYPAAIDIDIDDEELIGRVRQAFPVEPPAKFGSKGLTFFCRTDEPERKDLFMWKGRDAPVIEILATGQQTVVPPSLHPDTNASYEWRGPPLLGTSPADLPLLTEAIRAEIQEAVEKPDSKIFRLNTMHPSEGDGPGTIHNSVLAATGRWVKLCKDDDEIIARVMRAVRRALGDDFIGSRYANGRYEASILENITKARSKGFDKPKLKTKPEVHVAKWMMNQWKAPGLVCYRDGLIFDYDNQTGYFSLRTDEGLKRLIAHVCTSPYLSEAETDLGKAARTMLVLAPDLGTPVGRRVALANGTFDMDERQLLSHDPANCLISGLPFDYDEGAACPVYDAFIRHTMSSPDGSLSEEDVEKAINAFEEFTAMTLFECLKYQKFLVIIGETGTGKSTLGKIIKMLHAPSAVSSIPVHKLDEDQHRYAMLGRLVNISGEIPAMTHAADEHLKSITGGDTVMVRGLYRQSEYAVISARLVLFGNEMFRARDTSNAIARRMLRLDCNNPHDKEDPDLEDKLRTELPGIFNCMVRAWTRLRERGQFDPPLALDEQQRQYQEENNPAYRWLRDCTEQGRYRAMDMEIPPDLKPTPSNELYMHFQDWSKRMGLQVMSDVTWGHKLKQGGNLLKIDVTPRNQRLGMVTVWVRPLTLTSRSF